MAGTPPPEVEPEGPDRFRIRRTLALWSAAALAALVLTVLVVVFGGSQAMAERLNTIQGFAGVLVTALVTVIMGYGVSAHLDDKHRLDSGYVPQGDSYAPDRRSSVPNTKDPLASVITSAGRAAAKSYGARHVN